MSEERKPVWWKCPQCGLIVQCMDTAPKDGDDWPAGRACSRCLCGEMVLLWPETPARPDASEKPFAWAYRKDSSKLVEFSTNRAWPYGMQREFGGEVIPLYRSPTLTDAERQAVEWFAEVRKPLDSLDGGEYVAALRALRERIGREVFDRLCAVNAPKQERTSGTHATPALGSVQG